jgi:hypothetical protein
MRITSITAVAISLTMLAGCVAMPMNRTYYEPNPADGIPIRSSSCGWHATALDALERDIEGIVISVFPRYEKGKPLSIYVLLGKTTKSVDTNFEMIELRAGNNATSVRPITTTTKSAGPYYFMSANYVFPSSFDADEMSLTFLPGFIKLDGRDIVVAPFRFKRTTKSDFYYNSINC